MIEQYVNTIQNMDCLEFMKQLPDNCIDCIVTDPPYNISRETNFNTMKNHRGTSMDFGYWDKDFDIIEFISFLPKILKESANIVIFNSWKNIGDIAKQMRINEIEPKRSLVIRKSNPAPFNRDRLFVNDLEFAVWGVFKNKDWVFNRQNDLQKCFFDTQVQNKDLHPTMKDIVVIADLIKILSNENDIIFDPFIGSGTTAIACLETKRRYIGCELDKGYFDIAQKRIDDYNKQLKLF